MSKQKNIVEKYLELRGQFVIAISGMPGSHKLELGENIKRDFKFELINQCNYYIKDYDQKVTLSGVDSNGEKIDHVITNCYNDDAIDWKRFNNDIAVQSKIGVVVVGMSLPTDKINVDIDYHIHINISKQVALERISDYITKNKNLYPEDYKIVGTPLEKLKFNKYLFPYYLETTKSMKIDKFINANELTIDKIYDLAFDMLMAFVNKFIDDYHQGKIPFSIKSEMELTDSENPSTSYDDEIDMFKKVDDTDTDTDTDTESDTESEE